MSKAIHSKTNMDKACISIPFTTRWPMRQTGERSFVVEVPTGGTTPIIHPPFADVQRMTDAEIKSAEIAVLRTLAVSK